MSDRSTASATRPSTAGAHLVVGGFPAGSPAGHDMDFARRRLLDLLAEPTEPVAQTTVCSDYSDLERWLAPARLLITYVAGPIPDVEQNAALASWLEGGGRWLALHGTSGGRAVRIPDSRQRQMARSPHHDTLGGFFLNHPPLARFSVAVNSASSHPLVAGLPASFEVADELYLIELTDPANTEILLTTSLPVDPSPPGFGFTYPHDTALQADGRTRVLGYRRPLGAGEVAYVALGHCHAPTCNVQPFVDPSVAADGRTPLTFAGSWASDDFVRLLRNGIAWGLAAR